MEDDRIVAMAWVLQSANHFIDIKAKRSGRTLAQKQLELYQIYGGDASKLPDFLKGQLDFKLEGNQYEWPRLLKLATSKPTKNELELLNI